MGGVVGGWGKVVGGWGKVVGGWGKVVGGWGKVVGGWGKVVGRWGKVAGSECGRGVWVSVPVGWLRGEWVERFFAENLHFKFAKFCVRDPSSIKSFAVEFFFSTITYSPIASSKCLRIGCARK